MTWHPRRLLAVLALCTPVLAGCGAADRGAATVGPGATGRTLALAPVAGLDALRGNPREGHPWFPLTPGRYTDFVIHRYTVDEPSYIRATMGHPEPFFGRMATPWVYSEIPGRPVDATLNGLRQYFSLAPDGALWFHGAQNNGFMSYTEPPVRQLPAQVRVDAASLDTVEFKSYLPGGMPFYEARQTFLWSITDIEWLTLPAGSYRAARATVVIDDVLAGGAGIAEAALFGGGMAAAIAAKDGGLDAAIVDRSRREATGRGPGEGELVPERGMWFARHTGLVARDYPHGPGPVVINITTYERLGEGFGPVPEPSSAP
jgi:hypothetical protein